MFFRYAFFIALVLNPLGVLSQDCRFYGQSCSDDFSCCGGCCLKGICKDTYMDCRTNVADPCKNRYCREDEVCFTYQPPGCIGCGPIIECRTVPIPKDLQKNKTYTHYHLFSANSSESLGPNLSFLFNCCTFILIFIIL